MDKNKITTMPVQKAEILQTELPDSLVVYDMSTSQGHDLQPLAAFVWRSCDGRTLVSDIARLAKDEYGIESGEEAVLFILDQLREKRLLEEASDQPILYSSISRRDMVRKYLPAAMVLPFILSATAPTTAQLVSGNCVRHHPDERYLPEERCGLKDAPLRKSLVGNGPEEWLPLLAAVSC